MQDDAPVFGKRVEGRTYIDRPSAYALVVRATGELAVVATGHGFFLPGGGLERNESSEQAIEREAAEECGFRLRVGELLGRATEIVHSAGENACFEKRSSFFKAELLEVSPAAEPGSELRWVTPERAVAMLAHESHRWAVRRLIDGAA